MNTPNNYKSVYKNTGLTPRTYDQAYNTADYATPFWRCETDKDRGVKIIFNWLGVAVVVLLMTCMVVAVYMFLGS